MMVGCSLGLLGGYGNYNSPGFLKSVYLEKLDISDTYFNLLFSVPSFVLLPTFPLMIKITSIIGDSTAVVITALLMCIG